MSHYHAVVWLDHSEAHVMHIAPDDVEASIIRPKHPHSHLHAKSGAVGSGKATEDKQYYHAIADALQGAEEILVVGPAQAKLQLIKHLHSHDPQVLDKLQLGLRGAHHQNFFCALQRVRNRMVVVLVFRGLA